MKNLRLQAARKKAGKTQKEVAAQVGISRSIYWQYESMACEPRVGIAIAIADCLEVADIREIFHARSDNQ